jgi:N-acetylmuramoyl-L-alanine amidase
MKRMTAGRLIVLFLIWAGMTSIGWAQWETVRLNNSTWVTFKSFCDFYGFRNQRNIGEKSLEVSGPLGTLRFTRDSNEASMNGQKVWMSFKLTESSGQLLLNQIDVAKLWEPLLRPSRIRGLRAPRGVVVDAGHGGTDRGARGLLRLVEKDVALDTAQRLAAALKKNRIPVVMTRNSDTFISLEQRAAIAAQYRDYIFVSVHYNYGPRHAAGVETFSLTPQYAPSTSGPQTVRMSDMQREAGNRQDEANISLSNLIHQEMRKLHPEKNDRGIKRARFAVLRLNQLPAVLVEGGFVTNPGDAALIASESYRQRLADSVARGVVNYFRLAKGRVSGASDDDDNEVAAAPVRQPPPPPIPEPPKPATPSQPPPKPEPKKPEPKPAPSKPEPAVVAAVTEPVKPPKPAPAPTPPVRPAPTPPPPPELKPVGAATHRIQSGDTLSRIAARYGVSVAQLKQWNGLNSDIIRAGDTLKVRAPEGEAPSPKPPAPESAAPPPAVDTEAPAVPEREAPAPVKETPPSEPAPSPPSGPSIDTAGPSLETEKQPEESKTPAPSENAE